jgi:hypothetical protein
MVEAVRVARFDQRAPELEAESANGPEVQRVDFVIKCLWFVPDRLLLPSREPTA